MYTYVYIYIFIERMSIIKHLDFSIETDSQNRSHLITLDI